MDDREVVRRGYDDLGGRYQDARGAESPIVDEFLDRFDSGARVLDAGCGPGDPVLVRLADGSDAIGVDLSREQLGLARENAPGASLVQADMTNLPFAADVFDGIVALNSVIHVPGDVNGDVYAEFDRLLVPGGYLLLTTGTEDWEGSNPNWLDAGVEMRWHILGPERTDALLEEAGFGILEEWTVDDELGGEFRTLLARSRASQ